jgi:hypothetical protein
MRSGIVLIVLVATATLLVAPSLAPNAEAFGIGPIPLNCNRACLEDVVDQYLAAVVAHDPGRAPLSEDVMYTENSQVMDIGDGFWKTAQERGNYTHIFADPEFGQVAFMGTMIEADNPILMSRACVSNSVASLKSKASTSSLAAAARTTLPRWTRLTCPKTSGSSRFRLRTRCRDRN